MMYILHNHTFVLTFFYTVYLCTVQTEVVLKIKEPVLGMKNVYAHLFSSLSLC